MIFDRIKQKYGNRNRYPTSVTAVKTEEDFKMVLDEIVDQLKDFETRISNLERRPR